MLKKYSIIALFLFAYTIVLAHSIIPHHHHDEEHGTDHPSNHHDEHENDHHDNDQDDDGSLAHEFEKYLHSSGTADVYQKSDLKINNTMMATVYLVAAFNFNIKAVESPPPVVRLSNDCIPLVQHCLSTKGLRAPPCALI